ncbi:MAG: hypothetical protein NZM04_00275 [Methylacidiphilales bacterium]|nr:hypothetical protein [Candidatus Methylacidiphilales bacterium]
MKEFMWLVALLISITLFSYLIYKLSKRFSGVLKKDFSDFSYPFSLALLVYMSIELGQIGFNKISTRMLIQLIFVVGFFMALLGMYYSKKRNGEK